ncbi:hypothetical protein TRFO_06952 [Tritrichomonas foetus]|uniref:Sec1 family protein n=1 Tax=Tritrichomonas foetus TaxID=1144522 RepID=A0A1J4JWR4_9EUKA|nr:hypothetical protein TRFO_06952 [Tritrichomonas foetus]|eukprot:OHT02896.1 hypothetical protein TRFO_06952 [Tritrichomonas foetus]
MDRLIFYESGKVLSNFLEVRFTIIYGKNHMENRISELMEVVNVFRILLSKLFDHLCIQLLMDFLQEKFPPGTILFVDKTCAATLSITHQFENLVPKKFASICDIDQEPISIQKLLERFISLFEFEHIILMLSTPISSYLPQIQQILDFGEYDIINIFTTVKDDDFSVLPKSIKQNIIKEIPSLIIPITNNFSLLPTLPSILPSLLNISPPLDISELSIIFSDIFRQITKVPIKSFGYGQFSEKLMEVLESNQKGEPGAAALFIDRNLVASPLFTNDGSLLDKSSKLNLFATLQDKELIKSELSGNLLNKISEILKMKPNSSFNALKKQFNSLSIKEKFEISKKYPSISFIFTDDDLQITNMQKSLLNGADFVDIIEGSVLSIEQTVKLIGFQNMIYPINVQNFLQKAMHQTNTNELDGLRDENELNNILSGCSSGVDLEPENSYSFSEIHYLPKLLSFLFDKNATIDNEIVTSSPSLLGSFFKSSNSTLKDFNKIYIFVLGGISFFELAELEKMKKSSNTNIDFHICSDTICSSINLFKK